MRKVTIVMVCKIMDEDIDKIFTNFSKATCFSVLHLFGRVSRTLIWELQS